MNGLIFSKAGGHDFPFYPHILFLASLKPQSYFSVCITKSLIYLLPHVLVSISSAVDLHYSFSYHSLILCLPPRISTMVANYL